MVLTEPPKVGGRLHGPREVKSAAKPLTSDRASSGLAHGGAPEAPRRAASKPAKRAALLEIDKIQVDFQPTEGIAKLLDEARRETGYAAWRMMSAWLAWHELAGTSELLRRGEAAAAFPPGGVQRAMYRAGTIAAPRVNPVSIQWTNQWLIKTLGEQTSPLSSLKRWQAVLLAAERWPQFGALPLRVYHTFCHVERRGGHLWLCPKLIKGNDGKYLPLTLRVRSPSGTPGGHKNRRWRRGYDRLGRIADGVDKMPGCLLTERRGKWFFALVHDAEFQPVAGTDKLLILRTSRRAALVARYAGRSVKLGADELLPLGRKRRQFMAARTHHTRDERAWWNYCANLSHRLINKIVDAVQKHGVENVIVLAGRTDSALNTCGLEENERKREPTKFPIAQFQVFLGQKLIPRGVSVVTRANFRSVKRRKQRRANELLAGLVREAAG